MTSSAGNWIRVSNLLDSCALLSLRGLWKQEWCRKMKRPWSYDADCRLLFLEMVSSNKISFHDDQEKIIQSGNMDFWDISLFTTLLLFGPFKLSKQVRNALHLVKRIRNAIHHTPTKSLDIETYNDLLRQFDDASKILGFDTKIMESILALADSGVVDAIVPSSRTSSYVDNEKHRLMQYIEEMEDLSVDNVMVEAPAKLRLFVKPEDVAFPVFTGLTKLVLGHRTEIMEGLESKSLVANDSIVYIPIEEEELIHTTITLSYDNVLCQWNLKCSRENLKIEIVNTDIISISTSNNVIQSGGIIRFGSHEFQVIEHFVPPLPFKSTSVPFW